MAISKIILNGVTQMDVTQDTVTASSMALDVTAHGADGELVTGNIASKSSSDLTASGATVTAPAGLYTADATKTVASGTEGTPSATKGTVNNHSVPVTPSVTNTAGYISGGTKTGTAVTVSASELASGNKSINQNGTGIDVVGYSTVSVAVPNSIVIADASNSTGTTAVITADNIGTLITKTITSNGTYAASSDNADGYSSVTVNVSGGGSTLNGTFTGGGTQTATISCSFEPREVYIYTTEMGNDVTSRGVISMDIVKDTLACLIVDGSTSNSTPSLYFATHSINGYNEDNTSDELYATYSNGALTVNSGENTSSTRFASGLEYTYILRG